jgi:hypothetical protein
MRQRDPWLHFRRFTLAAVVAAGVLAIVGSGGGIGAVGFPSIDWHPVLPPAAFVSITPSRPTVQAGTIVEFSIRTIIADPPASYQWRRDGVDIAGATGPTYTLGGATLADDGAQFQLVVQAANGAATGTAVLRVSPHPGVVFEDADFATASWSAAATTQPTSNGPTYTVARAADGGNPGPYRSIAYEMTPAPSSVRLVHTYTDAGYDAATQGAVYTIDFALACTRTGTSSAMNNETPRAWPMVEQAGRTYVPANWNATCLTWHTTLGQSLLPADLQLVSGPPCGANETCPDYSTTAPPLRFGFLTELAISGSSPGGALVQGVDNWTVTVWRR